MRHSRFVPYQTKEKYVILILRTVLTSTVAIEGGYFQTHGVLRMFAEHSNLEVVPFDKELNNLEKGDILYIESPKNPTCLMDDIQVVRPWYNLHDPLRLYKPLSSDRNLVERKSSFEGRLCSS
jgi:hypothetical protein